MTLYPSLADVLAAHARLIILFGGAQGVRDRAALEAALGRPQSGYYRDLLEQAAALLESLSQNHPFVDGNKRTAIAAGWRRGHLCVSALDCITVNRRAASHGQRFSGRGLPSRARNLQATTEWQP